MTPRAFQRKPPQASNAPRQQCRCCSVLKVALRSCVASSFGCCSVGIRAWHECAWQVGFSTEACEARLCGLFKMEQGYFEALHRTTTTPYSSSNRAHLPLQIDALRAVDADQCQEKYKNLEQTTKISRSTLDARGNQRLNHIVLFLNIILTNTNW